MKILLSWVEEYTKLTMTPEELRDRISVSLTEVESMEKFEDRYKGIIVGEVTEVEKHPTTESLIILTINTGKKTVKTVVQTCKVRKGDKVPYLPVGVFIPGEIGAGGKKVMVDRTEVKGVASEGMVPSGRELGLNHDHTTVYLLDKEATVGQSLSEALNLEDYVMEIKNKALTHRPDAFSIEGLAREIAAIQGTKYRELKWLYDPSSIRPEVTRDDLPLEIINEARALCPRYIAIVLDNVRVGPSPRWLQIRLAKMGIRPVNNVVDISNYLMLETGQPNHAFDYDKVVKRDPDFKDKAVIKVRLAKAGEKITTLDGQLKELYDDTIVIADHQSPIGVAGVMGGQDTEIDEHTRRVIFQVENLDMYSVRRTSMKLGIFSDAVMRFSKGLDPNRCEPVLYKGIQMMKEHAGAAIASKIVDVYPQPVKPHSVTVSPGIIRSRIGADVADGLIIAILTRLGMQCTSDKKNRTVTAVVPTFRRDITISQDIEEEVVRIYGYDKISPTLPSRSAGPVEQSVSRSRRKSIKTILSALGANEMYTYSFVGSPTYRALGLSLSNAHMLANPLSPDLKYMRPLIAPSLLEKVSTNIKHRPEYAAFEIDMVNPVQDDPKEGSLPDEPWHIGFVHTVSYYHAKYFVMELLKRLHVSDVRIVPSGKIDQKRIPTWILYAIAMYHPSRMGYISVNSDIVGVLGEVRPDVVENRDIPQGTSVFELSADLLLPHTSSIPPYKDPSVFPAVVHDFSFITENSVPYSALEESILEIDPKSEVIADVACIDIYSDKNLGDKKKTALRVTFQRSDRTLEEDDIESIRKKIVDSVHRKVGGALAGE